MDVPEKISSMITANLMYPVAWVLTTYRDGLWGPLGDVAERLLLYGILCGRTVV